MPLLNGLRTIRSSIHGYGVIAIRPFYRGDIVVFGDGVLWREDEEFDDTYALVLPGYEKKPDGSEGKPLYWDLACQSRWFNHSCAPNTEVETSWDAATKIPKAWWIATRTIEPGEEILYDYSFSGHLAEPCFCKAPQCRGVICDPDELHLVPDQYKHLVRKPATETPSPITNGESK